MAVKNKSRLLLTLVILNDFAPVAGKTPGNRKKLSLFYQNGQLETFHPLF